MSLTIAASAGVTAVPVARASASPASTPTTATVAACPPAAPGQMACFALGLRAQYRRQMRPAVAAATVEAPNGGYAPQDLESAYGLSSTVATNGATQTVAIVDAYYDPTAASDLAQFRSYFGLPACTVSSGCFTPVDLSHGRTDPNAAATGGGWELEESLDMEAVSSACPLCHILLVEAADTYDSSLVAAIQRAVALHATVVSLSFGGCEAQSSANTFDPALQAAGVPVVVSSGDYGYYSADNGNNPGCPLTTPNYPASSPYVSAVGGTTLEHVGGQGRGWLESAWSYSGSGCSAFEPKPAWQADAGCSARTVADVAADADPSTGLSVYDTFDTQAWWQPVGGTSLSAPLVAGVIALAGAPRAAVDGQVWYQAPPLFDVTSGTNAPSPADCTPSYLCNAVSGYDGPTGNGTPDGLPLAPVTMSALPATESSTAVPLSWAPPPSVTAARYQVWSEDTTTGAGWMQWAPTPGNVTSTTFYGFRGHSYAFAVQYFLGDGSSDGAPAGPATQTAITQTATLAMGYTGMYAVDGSGTLHPASSPPLATTFTSSASLARGVALSPTAEGGEVLDGWGGLHPFGDGAPATGGGYWPGWDITRGVATLAGYGGGGYVLDGWGGLHAFATGGSTPAVATGFTYWYGWDIARGVATFADGSGGVVLDGWGGVHAFAAGSAPQPAQADYSGYWKGWDIARGIALLPGSTAASYSGYVLDGWGGLHPFASTTQSLPPPLAIGAYWQGWDIARGVVFEPGSSTRGYVLDGFGGFHHFGASAPPSPLVTPNYGAGAPLVRGAAAG